MEALQIEILDPKALQLIEGMQNLKLIKISKSPASQLSAYLKKTRAHAATAPSDKEIAKIVDAVRSKRYEKK